MGHNLECNMTLENEANIMLVFHDKKNMVEKSNWHNAESILSESTCEL